MGVDQSPGTTAVDTGDGTAVGVVPNTEVIAEINAVTIRRLGAVYLPPTAGGPAPSHSAPPQGEPTAPPPSADPGIETALTTLRALGYRLSTPVRDALTIPEQAWALVNAAARVTSGSPAAEYRPFYPDFPVQVHTASEDTLLVNAALHYLGDVVGARILPGYRPSPREPLPGDDGALTELGLATEQDLKWIVADLFAQATPFSVQDRSDLKALRDHCPNFVSDQAPRIAVKENLAVLTAAFPGLDFSGAYRTVADVLRLAVAMVGGDVSLAEPCRFPSFSRGQRRRLLGLLDAVGQVQDSRGSVKEMARRSERWKRLARHLRPGDYTHRFPHAAELQRQVASGRTERSFGSRLEEAFARDDVESALRLLATRPGVFARRLNHLLRLCADDAARERVVAELARVASEVSLPVLVRLWEYFSSPGQTPCRGGSLPSRRPRAPRRRSSPPPVAPAPPTPRWFAPSRRPCAGGHTWGGSPLISGSMRATRLRWDYVRPHRACARRGVEPGCLCPRARRSASSCTGATWPWAWASTRWRTWITAATGPWRICSTCWRVGACRWRTCWGSWPTTSSRTPIRPSWSSAKAGSCRGRPSGS